MTMKIYTKSGDAGETGLLFGGRVPKNDPRCVAYGEADFATSAMGLARALSQDARVQEILLQVQREMFTLSGELATDIDNYEHYKSNFHAITAENVDRLETLIDELSARVELPPKFIIPGASAASGALDSGKERAAGSRAQHCGAGSAGLTAEYRAAALCEPPCRPAIYACPLRG